MAFSWTARTLPSAAAWEYVAYGGGTFVAIVSGTSNVAATSIDNGATWTARTRAESRTLNGIAYGGGVFCAIGSGSLNACETTPDGITWTTRPLGGIRAYQAIAYGAGTFCAIANLTSIAATSTDGGVTFVEQALPSSGDWFDIAWDGTVFCTVMRNSANAATSPDGVTWTARTLPASRQWRSIASNGAGIFVALAYSTAVCAVSTDHGVSWTEYAMPSSNFWWGITWTGSKFVTVTNFDDVFAESSDGTSWTAGALPSVTGWHGIASDGAEHLVVVSNDTSTSALSGEGTLPVTINESLGFAQSLPTITVSSLDNSLALATSTELSEVYAIVESLAISGPATAAATLRATISESLALNPTLRLVLPALVSETLDFSDVATLTALKLVSLVDTLRISGAATSTVAALATISEALALAQTLRSVQDGTLTDEFAVTAALETNLIALQTLTASLAFSDEMLGLAVVSVTVEDELALDDTLTGAQTLIGLIQDGLDFSVGFQFDGEPWLGLSLNAATKGLTSYTNYPFNSMASFNGATYGASDEGLYRVGGDDDAGTDIVWRIRTGLSNLGTGRHKAMDAAYLGYTANGRVALKVIVVGSSGEKKVYWYELAEQGASNARPGRVLVGRGLRSVYWGFELTNVDAGDIELDVIELHPIVLEGRLP